MAPYQQGSSSIFRLVYCVDGLYIHSINHVAFLLSWFGERPSQHEAV